MRAKVPLAFMTLILSSFLAPLLIIDVQAAGCSPNCFFKADTNIPASEGTVTVRLDNSTIHALNHTFTFANYTSHSIEVIDTLISASSGARYLFKQWSHNGIQWSTTPMLNGSPFPILANYTTAQNGPFVAEFEKQFQASFAFTDPSGQAISRPSSITLQGPRTVSIPNNASVYQNLWYRAAVWTVTDATWQSMPNMVNGTQTIDLRNGPVSAAQIRLRAYTATVRIVDRANSPIPGVSLFVRLTNQTSTELPFTTDSQGQVQLGYIPLGSYTVRVVYQNQDMGSWVVEASQTPVNTIQLNVGGTVSGPIISAVVLLTIFGVAMFLLLLAVKVRKPPLPPTI